MALDDDRQKARDYAVEKRQSEVRAAIDRVAEAAASKAGQKAAKRAASGYFLLILVLLIGATVYSRIQERRLETAVQRSCDRLNTLRVDEANRGFQTLWKGFYLARRRAQALADGADDNKVRQTNHQAVQQLTEFIDAMTWTPKTDCDAFASDPAGYVAPRPRPFSDKYLDLDVIPR